MNELATRLNLLAEELHEASNAMSAISSDIYKAHQNLKRLSRELRKQYKEENETEPEDNPSYHD